MLRHSPLVAAGVTLKAVGILGCHRVRQAAALLARGAHYPCRPFVITRLVALSACQCAGSVGASSLRLGGHASSLGLRQLLLQHIDFCLELRHPRGLNVQVVAVVLRLLA